MHGGYLPFSLSRLHEYMTGPNAAETDSSMYGQVRHACGI